MSPQRVFAGSLVAALLATSVALAEPGVQVAPATSTPPVPASVRTFLHDAVQKDVTTDASAAGLNGYTVYPALLELRRFDDGAKTATLVCIVELTMTKDGGPVVARVRGNATSPAATERELLKVAADAAAARLSSTLEALNQAQRNGGSVARR